MAWQSGIVTVLAGLTTASLLAAPAPAASTPRFRGTTLPAALERLEQGGLRLLYSSELVTESMRVRREPVGSEPRSILAEIVGAHGLVVEEGPGGMLVLVRDPDAAANQGRIVGLLRRISDGTPLSGAVVVLVSAQRRAFADEHGRFEFRAVAVGRHEVLVQGDALAMPLRAEVEVRRRETATLRLDARDVTTQDLAEVIVTASRYQVGRDSIASLTALTASDLARIPEFGDDPVRTLARLPGMSGSDFSAKLNVRGGAADEVLLRFDGLRLVNPFHLKDFLSPFSALNPDFVGDIDVYSGGFPARFGDRLSAVVDIAPSPRPVRPVREVTLSVFNAALLVAAPIERGDWLVAARRGNLDLVTRALKPELGRPKYRDFHARVHREAGEGFDLSGNMLFVDDDIDLRDADDEERATARYRDVYGWLRLRYEPDGNDLRGDTVLAWSHLKSRRSGTLEQPGVGNGELSDRRKFDILSLQTDWSWRLSDRGLFSLGGEWRHARGRYDYRDRVEFEMLLDHPGATRDSERERDLSVRPRVDYAGAHAGLRFEGPAGLTSEAGMRVDAENGRDHWTLRASPRLALRYPVGDRLQLRMSWGRFVQTQGIEELAVPDGETGFARPQRADHLIAGLEYRAPGGLDIRLEAYDKRYRDVRARHENLLNSFVILPELKPDRVRIEPVRARSRGVELSLRRSETRHVDWWLYYQHASARDDLGSAKARRAWDQRHRLSGGLVWHGREWEASLAGIYHSGWPTTELVLANGADPPVATVVETVNSRRLRAYASLDARVARRFRFAGDDELTLFLEVTNLLNRKNRCCVDFDLDDEAEDPILDASVVKARPIVPSVGFVWRF